MSHIAALLLHVLASFCRFLSKHLAALLLRFVVCVPAVAALLLHALDRFRSVLYIKLLAALLLRSAACVPRCLVIPSSPAAYLCCAPLHALQHFCVLLVISSSIAAWTFATILQPCCLFIPGAADGALDAYTLFPQQPCCSYNCLGVMKTQLRCPYTYLQVHTLYSTIPQRASNANAEANPFSFSHGRKPQQPSMQPNMQEMMMMMMQHMHQQSLGQQEQLPGLRIYRQQSVYGKRASAMLEDAREGVEDKGTSPKVAMPKKLPVEERSNTQTDDDDDHDDIDDRHSDVESGNEDKAPKPPARLPKKPKVSLVEASSKLVAALSDGKAERKAAASSHRSKAAAPSKKPAACEKATAGEKAAPKKKHSGSKGKPTSSKIWLSKIPEAVKRKYSGGCAKCRYAKSGCSRSCYRQRGQLE